MNGRVEPQNKGLIGRTGTAEHIRLYGDFINISTYTSSCEMTSKRANEEAEKLLQVLSSFIFRTGQKSIKDCKEELFESSLCTKIFPFSALGDQTTMKRLFALVKVMSGLLITVITLTSANTDVLDRTQGP
uniref:RNase H domain-containing protein n=1 Tax=Steinernema glaseri TaxID=37863 RepID=A0A1I7YPM5_9BILA